MRKKIAALVCLLVAACLILVGCKMVSNYALKVNDTGYTIDEAAGFVNYYAGSSGSEEAAVEAMTEMAIIEQKAAEKGIVLTGEEIAALETQAAQDRTNEFNTLVFYATYIYNDQGLDEQTIRDYYISLFDTAGFRVQDYAARLKSEALEEKLTHALTADVTLTEEELLAGYQEYTSGEAFEEAKAAYDADPKTCADDIQNGEDVWYRPTDYRLVRQILIQYDESLEAAVDALQVKVDTLTAQVAELESAASVEAAAESVEAIESAEANGSVEADASVEADGSAEAAPSLDDLRQQLADAEAALSAKVEEAYATIQEEADAVVAAARAGEDWDALVAEHNDDPGMAAGAPTAGGYCVYQGAAYDEPFLNAALALESVGDISEPTRGSFHGLYIIRLVRNLPAGVVPLDEVRDGLEAELLHEKQHEAFDALLKQWISEANVVQDMNRVRKN